MLNYMAYKIYLNTMKHIRLEYITLEIASVLKTYLSMKSLKCICFNKIGNFLNIHRKHLYTSVFNLFTISIDPCVLQQSLVYETSRSLELWWIVFQVGVITGKRQWSLHIWHAERVINMNEAVNLVEHLLNWLREISPFKSLKGIFWVTEISKY